MPTIAIREKGENGDILRYENGLVFEGEIDSYGNPVWGEIRDSSGKQIHFGQIDYDIYEYLKLIQ